MWNCSGDPAGIPELVGELFIDPEVVGRPSRRCGTGRETLLRSGSGRETLQEVRKWSETLPEMWNWSGDPA